MLDISPGRFGDRRLENGGPGFMDGSCLEAAEGFAFDGWAVTGRGRFG